MSGDLVTVRMSDLNLENLMYYINSNINKKGSTIIFMEHQMLSVYKMMMNQDGTVIWKCSGLFDDSSDMWMYGELQWNRDNAKAVYADFYVDETPAKLQEIIKKVGKLLSLRDLLSRTVVRDYTLGKLTKKRRKDYEIRIDCSF